MKINCGYSELVDLDLLVPHKNNANKHPENQIKLLAKIIEFQGWRHPIIVSNRSKFIVSGHGRLAAAKLNGYEKAPVEYQDFSSEAEEYAFLISDNKIAELAEHDDNMMINDLKDMKFDLDFEFLGILDFNLDKIELVNSGDEKSEWVGMPEFNEGDKYIKLIFICASEANREKYVTDNNVKIEKKLSNQWIAYI